MKKLCAFFTFLLILIIVSCEIGLGSSVDTEVPQIDISHPLPKAIIRDSFIIDGTWTDDGTISSIGITLEDTETGKKYGSYPVNLKEKNNSNGKWSFTIEKGLIPDGSYEVTITIKDTAAHQNAIQRQISIDNTSPVLVMQRPSSDISAIETQGEIDNYGRIFSIEGQVADDSGIGCLDIEVYSDEKLENKIKTLSFSDVDKSISKDIAKFIQGVDNDYSLIYGSTDYTNGPKTLYCKIIAYDGAQRYPIDGSAQTEDDLKGNHTTTYYMYDAIAEKVLSDYTITDLYSMKNGRYSGTESARSAATDTLALYETTANVFILNPRNNPMFSVAGFTEMAEDGDFIAANMTVGNGDFLTIQVEPGLDGYPLVKDSLKVKVQRVGTTEWIDLSEKGSQVITKEGDKYKIIAYMRKDDGLVPSNKYVLTVEGHDEQNNSITTQDAIGYGFYFARSVMLPTFTVTEPEKDDALILNGASSNITIKGTVNFPSELCDSGDVIVQDITGTYKWKVGTFPTDINESWTFELDLKKDKEAAEYTTLDTKGNTVTYTYLPDNEWDLYIYAEYSDLDAPTVKKTTDKVKRSFIVDTKAPSTPELVEVNKTAYNASQWYTSQNLSIKVISEDEARNSYKSGVSTTEYKINDGEWLTLNSVSEGYINGLKEGVNELYFRNKDAVGNISNVNTVPTKLLVDTLKPVVKKAFMGDKATDKWTEFSTGKVLNLSKDHKKYLRIEIEENNTLKSVEAKIGDTLIAGTVASRTVETDNWVWLSNSEVEVANDETITLNVEVSDYANGKGTAEYKFLVDTMGPVITFTAPETNLSGENSISTENYTLKASINDAAGNVALTKYKITSNNFAEDNAIIAEANENNSVDNGWQEADNKGSINVPVTINEGKGISGNVTDGIISEGKWYFYIYSKDNAGNESIDKREFWTDRKVPALTVTTAPEAIYNITSLGANTSSAITVAGTASDANGVTEVIYSLDGGAHWSENILQDSGNWNFSKTYGSGAELEDSKYVLRIQAKDTAGKTTVKDYNILIDTNEPELVTKQIKDSKPWYKSLTIVPEITVADVTSEIKSVEYQMNGTGDWYPLTNLNGIWTGGVSFANDGANLTLNLKVTDEAGNICEDAITGINIDAKAPELKAIYYQIEGKDISDKLSETVWLDGSHKLTIWGKYEDSVSGVTEITGFTLGGNGTPITDITPAYSLDPLPTEKTGEMPTFSGYSEDNKTLIKSWKVEIPNAKLNSGILGLSGADIVGNVCNTQILNITKDTLEPIIGNVSITDNSETTIAYLSSVEGEPLEYWVNNSNGKSFTIKGVSTDENRVSTTSLIIFDEENPAVEKHYSTESATAWEFAVNNLYEFTGSQVTAKITTTDLAGNKVESSITIKFDSSKPTFTHRIDKKGKDIDFRIGEYTNDAGDLDVGGKYQAGTWGNTTSLMIRGTLNETGCGLSRIYYKDYRGTAPTQEQISSLKKTDADGYIEADSILTAKSVDYTNKDNVKKLLSVTSSYKGEIKGLGEGSNYLVLFAEDKVGNIGFDTLVATPAADDVIPTDEEGNEIESAWNNIKDLWNKGFSYYSLNVDTVPPAITCYGSENHIQTKFTNGTANGADIELSGTCTDLGTESDSTASSGIGDVKVSVKIGTSTKEANANINRNTGTWTATIPASELNGIVDGKTYNIEAIATDVAGLSTSITAAILQGDKTAPVPSLITINPSVEKTNLYYVRPTLDEIIVNGSTDDTYSTTVYTWLKLVPIKTDETEAAAQYVYEASDTEHLGATGRTWALKIPAGTLSINEYAGAKLYVCTKDLAGNESSDNLLATLKFDESAPEYNSDDTEVGGNSSANNWHNNATLSLKGSWSDVAGVDKVYYKVFKNEQNTLSFDESTWSTFTGVEKTDGKYWFENTIEKFDDGINYVYMYAADKLGNNVLWLDSATQKKPLLIKVDTKSPEVSEYSDDYSFNKKHLTSGDVDIPLYFYAEDDISGIDTESVVITLDGTELKKEDNEFSIDFSEEEDNKVTLTIAKEKLTGAEYLSVVVTLKDLAGNYVDVLVGTINVDSDPPVVELNAPVDANEETKNIIEVNKTITITGTAKDSYLIEKPLTKFQYKEAGQENWNNLYADLENNENVTNAADFSVKIDTTKAPFYDGHTYSIRAQATDKAGKTGWSKSPDITFTVNQDTDRPIIEFTNLDLAEAAASENPMAELSLFTGMLKGYITDDDGIKSFTISIDGGEPDTISLNGSNWNYPISDGTKTIVFNVTDKSNTPFTTGIFTKAEDRAGSPKLTDGTSWLGIAKTPVDSLNPGTKFQLIVDNALPVFRNVKFKLSEDGEDSWVDNLPKLGGPIEKNNKFSLKLEAGDENGISSVKAVLDDDTDHPIFAIDISNADVTENKKKFRTYEFAEIDVTSLLDGTHTLQLTISDGALNEKQDTVNLPIDRVEPTLEITSPTAATTSSGTVWATGEISGAKSKGLFFAISPSSNIEPDGATAITKWEDFEGNKTDCENITLIPKYSTGLNFGILNWNIYFDNDLESTIDNHSILLNDYLVKYGITTVEKLNASSNSFDTLVKLYLWMKAEDEVGNTTVKCFPMVLDPQGDRPTINYSYPDRAGITLGGEVIIDGTVGDTGGAHPGVESVWVQMISAEHGSDTSTVYGNTNSFSLTGNDLDYLKNNGYKVYKMDTYDPENNTGTEWNGSGNPDEYAALANLSGTNWYLTINSNEYKEFNPIQGQQNQNKVAIRIYARDKDGKTSIKNDTFVLFDANKPVISNLQFVRYDSEDSETGFNPIESQFYDSNIYLKDEWWLTGEVSDDDSISSLTIDGKVLVENTTPKTDDDFAAWFDENDTDKKKAFFRYRLGTGEENSVGSQSVRIIAYDNAGTNPNQESKTYSVKYDNKKPDCASSEVTNTAVRNISSTVQQRNGFFKFSSTVEESDEGNNSQSGFAYTAFYFKREYTETNKPKVTKLYDVLQDRSTSMVGDISGLTLAKLGEEGTVNDNTIVTENDLYWFVKNITSDGTMTISVSNTTNVHINSLVNIGGAYYLVQSLTENSITLNRKVPAGKTKAYVALAGVIDNTVQESINTSKGTPKVDSDGYYKSTDLDRDDGDRMIENVSKQDTTWKWEANVCSKNIPDGPIKLCYVVFDKAGNCVYEEVSGYVCNNQPRIAGFTIATDYTGNNSLDESKTEYAAANYNKTKDSITDDSGEKMVYDPYAKSKNTNDFNPLEQSMEGGSETESLMTVRGLTTITPEIVGGNKKVYYTVDVTNSKNNKSLKGKFPTPLYSEADENDAESGGLNYDYTINESKPIVIQLGDLVALGDTEEPIPFIFTFTDETEGLSTLSATQQDEFSAELKVWLEINASQAGEPTASITPFYWNNLTDNSIMGSNTATSYKNLMGHIELEDDLPDDTFTDESGEMDRDPKVSGEIVLEGEAFDSKLLKEIKITMKFIGTIIEDEIETEGEKTVEKIVAKYDAESGLLVSQYSKDNYSSNGFWFEIIDKGEKKQKVDKTGHKVYWKLYWNTQKTGLVDSTTKTDVKISVTAENFGTPVCGSKDDNETYDGETYRSVAGAVLYKETTYNTVSADSNPYRVDIVPYVKDVDTTLSSYNTENTSVYSRTALGHYPVYMAEKNIKLSGFNLAGGKVTFDKGAAGENNANTAALDTDYKFTVPLGARSGDVTVTVNGITSLNNLNNNDAAGNYNKQPNNENNNLLTDNLVFDVWDINPSAAIPVNNSAKDIMMKVNPSNGLIGFAFCDGDLYWSMAKGTESSYTNWVAARDFIQCTGFAFDKNGQSYGVAAGGESDSGVADTFNFFVSSWGITYNYADTMENRKKTFDGENSNRIGFTAVGSNCNNVLKNRFQSPSIVSDGTYAFLAYYDLITGEIRFQGGKSVPASKGPIGTLADNFESKSAVKTLDQEHALLQVVASTSGITDSTDTDNTKDPAYSGEYVSIGLASEGTKTYVVMVWYDSIHNNLMYSYIEAPDSTATGLDRKNWSEPKPLLESAGKYCNLVVDSDNHVHVAAFDSANGDLKYVFIDDFKDPDSIITCTVDSYQTVGKELTIDVAKKGAYQIPHIGYWGNTPKKPRYAYLAEPTKFYKKSDAETEGAINEEYTGIWECGIVPTTSTITTDAKRRINVGVRKNSSGMLINSSTGTDAYDENTKSGKCYGNGTPYAVLAYGVKHSPTQDYVETAQMR